MARVSICNRLGQSHISKTGHLLLQLLKRFLQLLKVFHNDHPFHGPGPPELGFGLLLLSIQLLGVLPLRLELIVDMSQLAVELNDFGHVVHVASLRRWASLEITLYDAIHAGVAEGEHFLPRREHHQSHVGAAESAKLAGFLEKPAAALGEGDLEVDVVAHFLNLNPLAATAFLSFG